MLPGLWMQEGFKVGRLHVATLMKRMEIKASYRKPNTSKLAPEHKIYHYLLRKLPITRPNQVWAMDITYIPMRGASSVWPPLWTCVPGAYCPCGCR
jgi:putative transposase